MLGLDALADGGVMRQTQVGAAAARGRPVAPVLSGVQSEVVAEKDVGDHGHR